MADNKTRRVIEVQSDLYQKGRLEQSVKEGIAKSLPSRSSKGPDMYKEGVSKLQQYNDPTAHFRMVREEIAQAAKDKKTKVQFPTGETAMKIEGLGFENVWEYKDINGRFGFSQLTPEKMSVGKEVLTNGGRDPWIITDVLGDGKFKAIPKDTYEVSQKATGKYSHLKDLEQYKETFDISDKIDESDPIYRFYEKEVGKYLKSKYNAKEITDNQGVSWYEVDIKPEMKGPIEAFGIGAIPLATQINQDKK